MKKDKIATRLAIFDFDGTLTKSKYSCWRYIWDRIGKAERDEELYQQFAQGKYTAEEWTAEAVKEFRENGVNKELFNEIAKSIVLVDGVRETFEYLKAHGVKIYIFSGGIKKMIMSSLGSIVELVDDIECEDLVFGDDGLVCGSVRPTFDTTCKCSFVKELGEKLSIKPNKIFFMGNGKNDESVHKTGATTLCVNPRRTDPYDKNCWDYYIEDIKNLKEIIPFIK